MIHFCVWSQISSTEISQILIDPMAAWDNLMVIALACEQISDSFCFIKNWSLRSQKQERFQNCPRIQALFRLCFFVLSGFAELQTDMTDLTKELNRSQGIPFLEYKQFVTRTFFPKVRKPIFPRYLISTGTLTIRFVSRGFNIFSLHVPFNIFSLLVI